MNSIITKLSRFSLFTCMFFLVFSACKKKEDPAPAPVTTNPNSITRFFRATIGSVPIDYTENHTNTIGDLGASGLTESPNTWMLYSASILHPYDGIKNSIQMQVGNILVTDGTTKASEAQFNSFFASGTKSYTSTTDEKTYDGVLLLWFDSNGGNWSSIGDQTGSTFTIDKVTKTAATSTTDARVDVEASFSCNLYSNGNSKSVTNGKLKLTFQNMNKLN